MDEISYVQAFMLLLQNKSTQRMFNLMVQGAENVKSKVLESQKLDEENNVLINALNPPAMPVNHPWGEITLSADANSICT